MKKTIVCCDITGKEVACKETVFRLGKEEQSYLDAAGDTDYRLIDHVRSFDLSHEGAVILLQNIVTVLKDGETSPGIARLQKALDKAVTNSKRCQN